jgi:hypothetical protein
MVGRALMIAVIALYVAMAVSVFVTGCPWGVCN